MITAKELIEQSKENAPKSADSDNLKTERRVLLREFEAKILSDLQAVGVELRGVGGRFSNRQDNVKALPVLARYLNADVPFEIKEAIARSMAIPEALPYRNLAVDGFVDVALGESVRYAFGLVVAKTTNGDNIDETISLVRDRALGEPRMALLLALKSKRNSPKVASVLVEIKSDPDLEREISSW